MNVTPVDVTRPESRPALVPSWSEGHTPTRSSTRSRMARRIAVYALGGLLAYFGLAKLVSPSGTDTVFGALPIPVRTSVITIELMMAAWLLSGWYRRVALYLTVAMLAGFTGVLVTELMKPAPRSCGCSGGLVASTSNEANVDRIRSQLKWGTARNVVAIAGAVWLAWAANGHAGDQSKKSSTEKV